MKIKEFYHTPTHLSHEEWYKKLNLPETIRRELLDMDEYPILSELAKIHRMQGAEYTLSKLYEVLFNNELPFPANEIEVLVRQDYDSEYPYEELTIVSFYRTHLSRLEYKAEYEEYVQNYYSYHKQLKNIINKDVLSGDIKENVKVLWN
jgi:hypothetical protein